YEEDARLRELAHKAARSIGAPMIEPLGQMLAEKNPMAQSGARQVLFDITAQSTAQDTPGSEKKVVINALQSSLDDCSSETASGYLDWLLELAKSAAK
ncbi:MAG: hypothetical protein ACOCWD_03325, partial [Tangfeifania sp.]